MTTIDLTELAALPAEVASLRAEVQELRARLAAAADRPRTIAEAAAELRVSTRTILRRIKSGEIKHRRIGRRVRVWL